VNALVVVAHILDPRNVKRAYEKILGLLDRRHIYDIERQSLISQLNNYFSGRGVFSSLSVRELADCLCPSDWWQTIKQDVPELSLLAVFSSLQQLVQVLNGVGVLFSI
jgi:hypothetical protein